MKISQLVSIQNLSIKNNLEEKLFQRIQSESKIEYGLLMILLLWDQPHMAAISPRKHQINITRSQKYNATSQMAMVLMEILLMQVPLKKNQCRDAKVTNQRKELFPRVLMIFHPFIGMILRKNLFLNHVQLWRCHQDRTNYTIPINIWCIINIWWDGHKNDLFEAI